MDVSKARQQKIETRCSPGKGIKNKEMENAMNNLISFNRDIIIRFM